MTDDTRSLFSFSHWRMFAHLVRVNVRANRAFHKTQPRTKSVLWAIWACVTVAWKDSSHV